MPKTEADTLREILRTPVAALRRELFRPDVAAMSSQAIATEAGVPASVIRALRNGQSGNAKATTWARLMVWALDRREAWGRSAGEGSGGGGKKKAA